MHVFIDISVFIGVYCGIYFYLSGMSLFQLYFYYLYWTYLFIYVFLLIYWNGSTFLFNTCTIKFIEGKFYFEGRACYIGKIMHTCIE